MIDMMLTEEELKNEHGPESVVMDKAKYPYGLKINLDSKSVKKLNMDLPQVGEKFIMLAKVEVCSVYKDEHYGDDSVNVGLQIIEMDLQKKQDSQEDIGEKLYGED